MPSRSSDRSNRLPRWLISLLEAPSWALSTAGHALLVLLIGLSFVSQPKDELVPFDVIELPPTAAQPMNPVRPGQRSKPRAVFGVSRKSITSSDGPTLKAGNTIAKEPDRKTLRPEDEDQLPIPTEEYLVSKMPELISEVRVAYPSEAKKRNIEGAVIFDILIDAAGAVREAFLVEGPGYGLDEAASIAVKKMRFRPAEVENQPVAVKIRYAYRFVIER